MERVRALAQRDGGVCGMMRVEWAGEDVKHGCGDWVLEDGAFLIWLSWDMNNGFDLLF